MNRFSILLLLSLIGINSQCSETRTRKEFRELSKQEYQRYVNAVKKLAKAPTDHGLSEMDKFTNVHLSSVSIAHGNVRFLPWHRVFIMNYENELRKIDEGVTLPYWDWSIDYREPHLSPIFDSVVGIGGNGNSSEKYDVTDGPFSRLAVSLPKSHNLKRQFDGGDYISSFSSPKVISTLIRNVDNFEEFATRIELIHGTPHDNIGGNSGDMRVMNSPNDPIFFLHHAFIDLLWTQWQIQHPTEEQYNGVVENKDATPKDNLEPFNINVQYSLSEVNVCVKYTKYQGMTESFSDSTTNKTTNYRPKKLSDTFLMMNNMNITRSRVYERQHNTLEFIL
jgi:hypothetical protein